MSAEVWSPGKPRAGQRVRIRISGECPFRDCFVAGQRACHAEMDGLEGFAGDPLGDPMIPQHDFAVYFPEPMVFHGQTYAGAVVAINELEPIDG